MVTLLSLPYRERERERVKRFVVQFPVRAT